MGNNALWKIIGNNFIFYGKFLQLGNQSPVTANDSFNKPFMPEMIQPSICTVPLAGGVYKGYIFWFFVF